MKRLYLRAVLDWAIRKEQHLEIGLSLAGALWRFWETQSHISDGRNWLDSALEKSQQLENEDPSFLAAKASALFAAGVLTRHQGDMEAAQELLEASLKLRRILGDLTGTAHTLNNLGVLARIQQEYPTAQAVLEESLALMRELDDQFGIAAVLTNLGTVAMSQQDYTQAKVLLEESIEMQRRIGDEWDLAYSLSRLGVIYLEFKDYNLADSLLRAC